MKKLLAMSLAAMMLMGLTPVKAADKNATTDIDTSDVNSDQDGEIWGTLSSEPLKQLIVTVPIRVDFAVVKGGTDAAPANTFSAGNYKIKVGSTSEVGVTLEKINVKSAKDTKWTLADKADITTATTGKSDEAAMKTVALEIAGKELSYGDNEVTSFEVAKGAEKSLGVTGTPTAATIGTSIQAKAELAFDVVYTIAQK